MELLKGKWVRHAPLLLGAAGALLLYRVAPSFREPSEPSTRIDVDPAELEAETKTAGYVSLAEQEFEARSRMIEGGLPLDKDASTRAQARPEQPRVDAERRSRELRFLAEHRKEMDQAVSEFYGAAKLRFKNDPKIREINAAFNRKNMPRFMELHDKYHKNDPFELWRKAFLLPEFRQGVRKYVTDPAAIKAGVRILADFASKAPPTPAVREGLFFAATDERANDFLRENFWPKVLPQLPGALQQAEVPAIARTPASGLAAVVSGTEGHKPGVPFEWTAKNTGKFDDKMKAAVYHGIDFYLMNQAGAKAQAETDKQDYHGRLKDKR
ncbi:MAG: hypothetical protein WC728_00745 [Elusimicrobiota bacterium]